MLKAAPEYRPSADMLGDTISPGGLLLLSADIPGCPFA